MEFELSKELRTLGVVEFVAFFIGTITNVKCTWNGQDFWVTAIFELIFSALGMGIYIAFLILFYRDVRVCDDSLITAVLVMAVVILGLKLLDKVFDSLLSKLFARMVKEAYQEALNANAAESVMVKETDQEALNENAAESVMSTATNMSGKMEDTFEKFKRHKRLLKFLLPGCVVLLILLWLVAAASAIFQFATLIKLAIPEDYQASCVDNSTVSKAIMFGMPSVTIAYYLLFIVYKFGLYVFLRTVNLAEVNLVSSGFAQGLVATIMIISSLGSVVLSFILFIRLLKVWRGEDLELYEYVGFGVCVPLLPFKFDGEESDSE